MTISPCDQVGACFWTDHSARRTQTPQRALNARSIELIHLSFYHFTPHLIDLSSQLQNSEHFLKVVDFYSLSYRILLQVCYAVRTFLFSYEVHEIFLAFCLDLTFIFLLVVGKNPYIHIFAFGAFDTFDEIVDTKLFEYFVEKIGGKLGAICKIFLGDGVLLNNSVNFAIVVI